MEVLHIHNCKKAVLHSKLHVHNTNSLLQYFWVVEEQDLDIVLERKIGKEPR